MIFSSPAPEKWRKHAVALAMVLPGVEPVVQQIAWML